MSNYTIQAPYPLNTSLIILPEPELGDSERLISTAAIARAMDGTTYSTVVTQSNSRGFRWTFDLTRLKALEFLEFYKTNHAEKWEVSRTAGTLVGFPILNPASLSMVERAVLAYSTEKVLLDLEFEKIQ